MIDELKKIPDNKLKLVANLQFSNKEVTVDTDDQILLQWPNQI